MELLGQRGARQGVEKVDNAGDDSRAGVMGDTIVYDNRVVALHASGEEVDAAGAHNKPDVDCLPFFLVGVWVPKIELMMSKSLPVSFTAAEATRIADARCSGKGVPWLLSLDLSPLSDMIMLLVQLNH
jgi:hypothetical protein